MATRAPARTTPARATMSPAGSHLLARVLGRARLQVLRVTILIGLLIAIGNLVGSIAGLSASGSITGPAIPLAAAWCGLWALAAALPALTARAFMQWQLVGVILVAANAATVAVTGGIESSVLAVCMYLGWIASVVVHDRPALVLSLGVTSSIVVGYLLSGDSVADILTGPHRYGAVTNAVLPLLAGLVGVLLATVTNAIFSRLAETLGGLRAGAPATTPALTALFAGRSVLELPARSVAGRDVVPRPRLTTAELEVVRLLAEGHHPKEIALLRAVGISTIRSQIKAAKKKTGTRTLSHLVAITWDELA